MQTIDIRSRVNKLIDILIICLILMILGKKLDGMVGFTKLKEKI